MTPLHFRHFRQLPGSEEQKPLFLWVDLVERKIVVLAIFRQNHLSSEGAKPPFSKTTVFTTLIKGNDKEVPRCTSRSPLASPCVYLL